MARPTGARQTRTMPGPQRPVDTVWLETKMRERGVTQVELAKALTLDGSGLNKRIGGDRRWQLSEMIETGRLLGVSSIELLYRMGYDLDPQTIPITGRVIDTGQVSALGASNDCITLNSAPPGAAALEITATNGPLGFLCGFFAVYDMGIEAGEGLGVYAIAGELVPILGTRQKNDKTIIRADGTTVQVKSLIYSHPVLMFIKQDGLTNGQ